MNEKEKQTDAVLSKCTANSGKQKKLGKVIFSSMYKIVQSMRWVKSKLGKKLQQNQAALEPTRLCDYVTITFYTVNDLIVTLSQINASCLINAVLLDAPR